MKRFWSILLGAIWSLSHSLPAQAEPYFALMTGTKCVACHTNPTGGGKRNTFGLVYPQTALSARRFDDVWDGNITERLSTGGDLRANLDWVDTANQDETLKFELEEALLYLEFTLLKDRLSFYIDEQVAPAGASSREAYALLWSDKREYYLKAGRMFLPFGWRLEDDTAFIRTVPGINYFTPDTGVEVGLERDAFSASLAITNGTAGGGEIDTGKQFSLHGVYTQPLWRIGASANHNDIDGGARNMYSLFGGLKTGPFSWLAEVDAISDKGAPGGTLDQLAGLFEVNYWVMQGHNLKLTLEYLDPNTDVDEDDRNRTSLVYEYYPMQYVQLNLGWRHSEGIPQADEQNTDAVFLQLHSYF